MTSFDDKEKAAENKYVRDKEREFKYRARAHKLLGLWVASKMGLSGAKAEEYAVSLVTIDLAKADPQQLFHKIRTDLLANQIHVADHDLRKEMHRFEQQAKQED